MTSKQYPQINLAVLVLAALEIRYKRIGANPEGESGRRPPSSRSERVRCGELKKGSRLPQLHEKRSRAGPFFVELEGVEPSSKGETGEIVLVRHSERAPFSRLAASGRSHPPGSPQYV